MSSGALHERDRRRQALLDELRGLHRAEPAPAELRERLAARTERGAFSGGGGYGRRSFAARARSLARGVSLARGRLGVALGASLALGVALRLGSTGWFGVDARTASPELALGPEPRGGASPRAEPDPSTLLPGVPVDARESAAPGESPPRESVRLLDGRVSRPCPLAALPRGAVRMPQHSGVPGFTAHTFEQRLPSCGPITRRYLELVPPGLALRTRAPVVIVLHDAGESAESLHAREGRQNFEVIAQRNEAVLIYANAAPGLATSVAVADSGAWQTDRRSHAEIDDEDYLRHIVQDLGTRDVIDGSNDIFLVGYGDGAAMALDAAVQSPGVYAGVAAFAPSNLAFVEPARPRASARLSRVMIVVEVPSRGTAEGWRVSMPMFARRWAAALGLEQKVIFRSWRFGNPRQPTGTLEQFDVSLPATASSGVRMYVVDGVVEDPPSALRAWDYLTGVDGDDASVPDDLPELPLILPDGHSVLPEDAEGIDVESVVLGEEMVKARPAAERRAP